MNSKYLSTAVSAFLFCSASLVSAAPNPPSDFKVQALGVNAFQLTWTDNSQDETGWRILAAFKGTAPVPFAAIPTTSVEILPNNRRSFLLFTPPTTDRTVDFRLASFNGAAGKESFSKPTPIVSVDSPSSATFGSPTKLKAKTLNDGVVLLSWKDNSTAESGYLIQIKPTSEKRWLTLPVVQPRKSFKIPVGILQPGTNYSFRIQAFIGNPAAPIRSTKFTKAVKATTKPFQAPSELVATPEGEGAFSFKWKDNSALETEFELQSKFGNGEFISNGTVPLNSTFANAVPNFA
jgi:Fibronectin type III domain